MRVQWVSAALEVVVFSRSLVRIGLLLALGSAAVGCPVVSERDDAGMDAPNDAAAWIDGGTQDVPSDGRTNDVREWSDTDASAPDAFASPDATTCLCDDDISCTRDTCDASGACVHASACPARQVCLFGGADEGCAETMLCTRNDQCADLPCQPTLGCIGGRCLYEWDPDQDGDGVASVMCGGLDCAPRDSTIPGIEICNFRDDDCNGVVDDGASLATDFANCGRCGNACSPGAELCRDGVCACNPGRALCPSETWPGPTCYDLQTDALHCGSCDLACPEGSTCEAGLCRYRATWMHGVDATVPLYTRGVLVAPNGDVLFEVFGRPTQLFHHGRSPDPIPPGASPFARHIVRLDRDGNLIGVTSIPEVYAGEGAVRILRTTLLLAVTDQGFYFAGNVGADTDILGTRYTPLGVSVIGYVPRGTSAIAWAQPLAAQGVLGTAGTREGVLVLLAARPTDARIGEQVALRRFDTAGVELSRDNRYDSLFLNSAQSVFSSSAGGFIVPARSHPTIPEVRTYGDPRESAALIFDADGMLQEAVAIGSLGEHLILDERPDASAWLVRPHNFQEHSRTSRRSLGDSFRYGPFAAFDESGVAAINSDGFPRQLERFRDTRMVETVTLPGIAYLEERSVWLLNASDSSLARQFVIPGAATTLSRVDLPPIP